MSTFAQIAPYLNNPLTIVGFVLFLLFGIHRLLIKSGIIPTIDKADAPDIIKLLLRYGFYVAIVVLILGFAYAFSQTYVKAVFLDGTVNVVSADIDDKRGDDLPLLDISFRNSGKAVAALTSIRFEIRHVWLAKSPYKPAARLKTGEYKVTLPLSAAGCTIFAKISQDIPSNNTDRFTISIANDASPTYDEYIFDVDVYALANEDRTEIPVGKFIFLAKAQQEWLAKNVNLERQIDASKYNHYVVKAIRSVRDAKISPEALEWIEGIEGFVVSGLKILQDNKNDKKLRLNVLVYLAGMGAAAADALPVLKSIKFDNRELRTQLEKTVSDIEKADKSSPDLTIVRFDGHTGCSEAPIDLRKKYSFPF